MLKIKEEYLAAIRSAALKAGREIRKGLKDKDKKIRFKGEIDLVTKMDLRSEEIITTLLTKRFPDISILAEEGGESDCNSSMRWLVDPLDGTTGFSHGVPHFSVSIALEINGEIEVGVVYNPCLDECFTAIKGVGAFLNGEKISVSDTGLLNRSLLATGFPYDRAFSPENNLNNFGAFLMKCQGIRRMGSAALDLCYTAAGRFDGYWEMKLNPWDTAAGVLILTEAGGTVSDFKGTKFSIYGKEILASNGRIHKEMTNILKELS